MAEGVPFGDYRLMRRLGAGGMAEVFLAKRLGPQGFSKQLVIKRLLPHLSGTDHFTSLFLKEARYAALIDHPNLAHVSDFGKVDGRYYLAMEFVDGSTLTEVLSLAGNLSPGVAARIGAELMGALAAIHGARSEDGQPLGLVHRDVGPRNLMLTREGTVKLLDFGIAVTAEETQTDAMGTRRFMSPEQSRGEALDARSDLFSAGVLLYTLLAGEPPSLGDPPVEPSRPEQMPVELWAIVGPLLALDREDRPETAREVQASLELYLAGRGLEGTRAHLADLAEGLVPGRRSAASRALTKLSDLTRTLVLGPTPRAGTPRLGSSGPPGAPEAKGSPARRPVLWISGVMLAALALGFLWRGLRPEPPSMVVPILVQTASATPARVVVTTALPPPVTTPPAAASEPESPRSAPRRPERARAGALTIDTTPWTEVYLAGRKLGLTPLSEVSLPSGKHELELRNPESGLVRRIQVTIRPGRVTRVQRAL